MPVLNRSDVFLEERDLSEVIPTPPSSSVGGIVIVSNKGPIDATQILTTNDFLKRCTRYGKPTDSTQYSALKFYDRSSNLYVARAVPDDIRYGGVVIKEGTKATVTGSVAGPFTIPAGAYSGGDNSGTGNGKVSWAAKAIGVVGDAYTMEFKDPLANNALLSVAVVGTDIVVNLATDGSGELISTARQVSDALNNSLAASALIVASYSGDGSDVVLDFVPQNFVGGDDPENEMSLVIDNEYSAEITLTAGTGITASAMAADIQRQLDLALGTSKVVVTSDVTGYISIASVKYGTASEIEIVTTPYHAYVILGFVVGVTTGTGAVTALTVGFTDPTAYSFGTGEMCLIYGNNPGLWNADLGIYVDNYNVTDNTFDIKVFIKNENGEELDAGEVYTVSRVADKKNEFGQNIYITSINTKSLNIKVRDNTGVADTAVPVYTASAVYLGGGIDGTTVSTGDIVNAWDKFTNKEVAPVNLLINGGKTDVTIQNKMITVAENRLDAIAILDVPYGSSPLEAATFSKTDLNADSSYAGLFYPWLKDYDSYNDKTTYIPPSAFYAAGAAYVDTIAYPWYPVAGESRGVCRCTGVERVLSDDDRVTLEAAKINPVSFKLGKGTYIWGNKTLQTKFTARSSLHVRRLLIYIETNIMSFLEGFLFEFNDDITRGNISYNIDQFMSNVLTNRGLYDYDVICDTTNNTPAVIDQNTLVVDVYVQPVKAAEKILLRVTILRTGASFEELATA